MQASVLPSTLTLLNIGHRLIEMLLIQLLKEIELFQEDQLGQLIDKLIAHLEDSI